MSGQDRDFEGPVDLAGEPPFRLGRLEVTPSTREVRHGETVTLAEPRALQVLIALHQANGSVVSRDALVRRCWDGRIVGEDAINRSIAKARQLADLADPPAFVIETIPRVGYRLKPGPEETVAVSGPSAPKRAVWSPSRRGLALGGAGVLALGAVGGAVLFWTRQIRDPHETPLVAVLPFDNESPDPQLGYLADGLAEDILSALARGGGVRVIARASSFRFRGGEKAHAAAALGAAYILDGSVLRSGDRLRVSTTLSDATKGETLWAETFDREMSQGLQLEDDIAGQVARALRFRLTARAPQRIEPEVFDIYLKAREAMRSIDTTVLKDARTLLQTVVERAPTFQSAWVQLAKSCFRDDYIYPSAAQRAAWDEVGRAAARRAIALDRRDGEPVALLAQIAPLAGAWTQIDRGQRRGLMLAPNDAELMLWRCWILQNMGRLQEALSFVQRAHVQDPLEYWTNRFRVRLLTYVSLTADAQAAQASNRAAWPDDMGVVWDHVWLLASSGREDEAADQLTAAASRLSKSSDGLRLAPSGAGAEAESDAVARAVAALRAVRGGALSDRQRAGEALANAAREGAWRSYDALLLLSRLGLLDQAAELARSLYLHRGAFVIDASSTDQPLRNAPYPYFLFDPLTAPLRQSGRLQEVFNGLGLIAFWKASGGPDQDLGIRL